MPSSQKIFRVFVSSTFSDMRAERRILQETVFPRLKKLCEGKGASFQAVDLRWGVNEADQLDHKTMDVCLGELAHCQRLSPKPNFILLLGDRYGWQPVPNRIPSTEMSLILKIMQQLNQGDAEFIDKWYREDLNALPAEYLLQPRGEAHQSYDAWSAVEGQLRALLRNAVSRLNFTDAQRLKYFASATHQEIVRGALQPPAGTAEPAEHVFAYMRTIRNLPEDKTAMQFIDLDGDGRDVYAKQQLEKLRADLKGAENQKGKLPREHVYEYEAEWQNGCHIDDLAAFGERVYADLEQIIDQQLADIQEVDDLTREVQLHEQFKNERIKHFVGQEEPLKAIRDYLASDSNKVFALIGPSGSGKTSIMAKVIEEARVDAAPRRDAGGGAGVFIFRFVGTTTGSSGIHTLLHQLVQQITAAYGTTISALLKDGEDERMFSDLTGLRRIFLRCLELASRARSLFIFLDALDQLSVDPTAAQLSWIPKCLPRHVKLVVSALPELQGPLSPAVIRHIAPMSEGDGSRIVDRWLSATGRTLQQFQRNEVMEKFAANGTPIYLKLAFERARTWHSYTPHVELKPDIEGVLAEFFDNLEQVHGTPEPSAAAKKNASPLVRMFCGCLSSGKHRGLAESELLDLFVFDKDFWQCFLDSTHHEHREEISTLGRFPIVVWSRLFSDLEPYLTERDATGVPVIAFFHRQFVEYTEKRYLPGNCSPYHRILADYFESRWRDPYIRSLDELPFQRMREKNGGGLEQVLTDLSFIQAKLEAGLSGGLLEDYHAVGAGMVCGPPILTALHGDAGYGVHCPFCLSISGVEPSSLGQGIACPFCSRQLIMNTFFLEANWAPSPLRQNPAIDDYQHIGISAALHDFALFTTEQLHVLKMHPGYTFQQAYNQANYRAVHEAAARQLYSDTFRSAWIKRRNLSDTLATSVMTLWGHSGLINQCSYSPAGDRLVTASLDGSCIVWDSRSGQAIHSLTGHDDDAIMSCSYSPDGKTILAGTDNGVVWIWDGLTGNLLTTGKSKGGRIHDIIFAPGGSWFILASSYWVSMWDASTRSIIRIIEKSTFRECCVSPDGKYILTVDSRHNISVWESESGELVTTHVGINDNDNEVTEHAIQYSPRGTMYATRNRSAICMWDSFSHGLLYTIAADSERAVYSFTFSPDGDSLLVLYSDGCLRIFDVHGTIGIQGRFHAGARCAAYSPDGKHVVFAALDCTAKVLEIGLLSRSPAADTVPTISNGALSPSSDALAVGCIDGSIRTYDVETTNVRKVMPGHGSLVLSCQHSPDCSRFLAGYHDDALRAWDPGTGELLYSAFIKPHHQLSHGGRGFLRHAPDGRYFMTGCNDAVTMMICDSVDGNVLQTIGLEWGSAKCGDFSPDGKRVAIADEYGKIRVWDIDCGKCIRSTSYSKAAHACPRACKYSPNGLYILAAMDEIALLDAADGVVLRTFSDIIDSSDINHFDFSADGEKIVASSSRGIVIVWDVSSGDVLSRYFGSSAFMFAKMLGSDRLVAGDTNGSVHFLELCGIEDGPGVVTPVRLYSSRERSFASSISATCPFCGNDLGVDKEVLLAIGQINAPLAKGQSPCESLPRAAWGNPILQTRCTLCHKVLRYNPFVVDNSERERIAKVVDSSMPDGELGLQANMPESGAAGVTEKPWWQFWKR